MTRKKWNSAVDQWFEDKVWTKVPDKHGSPHFFFLLGFMSAIVFTIILGILL